MYLDFIIYNWMIKNFIINKFCFNYFLIGVMMNFFFVVMVVFRINKIIKLKCLVMVLKFKWGVIRLEFILEKCIIDDDVYDLCDYNLLMDFIVMFYILKLFFSFGF